MKILITGAAGFVGRHLIAQLARTHQVTAIVRRPPEQEFPAGVELALVDLEQPIDVAQLPPAVDVIVHLAFAEHSFPTSASAAFAVHTAATQQLLDYARRVGARQFLFASSGDVYSSKLTGPSRESDLPRPDSFYGVTKYAAEMLVNCYGGLLAACVLRLYQPYGPGQSGRLIPRLAENIRAGRPIRVHPDNRPHLSPTYIDDVISAIDRSVADKLSGVYNLAGDEVVSIGELAGAIGRVVATAPAFEESMDQRGDLAGDSSSLQRALVWRPTVALAEGLQRTFGGAATRTSSP